MKYQPTKEPGKTDTTDLWWQRRGLLGWWLNLTAPPRPTDMSSLQSREYIRKAELTSISIIAYFFFQLAIFINPSNLEFSTILTQFFVLAILLLMAFFNRRGHILTAAYGLVIVIMGGAMASIALSTEGLSLIWLPAYDLLSIPIFISSLITHRRSSLIFAVLAALFIALDFTFQKHALFSGMGIKNLDEIAFALAQPTRNWWTMVNRHLVIVLSAGFFGWVTTLYFEKALTWAEQARKEADVAKALANDKDQSARELTLFINELVETFIAQANGEIRYLHSRPMSDPFYQHTLIMNDRLQRFQMLQKQQDMWNSRQVSASLNILSELLTQISTNQRSPQALAPGTFHSQTRAVDQIAGQVYKVLLTKTSIRH